MKCRARIIDSAGNIALIDASTHTMLGSLINVILAANPELKIRIYEKDKNGLFKSWRG